MRIVYFIILFTFVCNYAKNQGLTNSLQVLNNKVDKENLTTCKIQQLTSGTKFDISATDADRQYGFYYNYGTNQIGAGYKNNNENWNLSNVKLPPFVGETFNIYQGCVAFRTSNDGIMIILDIPFIVHQTTYSFSINQVIIREVGTTNSIDLSNSITSQSVTGIRDCQILITIHSPNATNINRLYEATYSYINVDFTRIS